MAVTRYDRMAHLLRRAAFGARPDEINAHLRKGFEATVDELVNYENVPEDPAIPAQPTTSGGGFNIELLDVPGVMAWWYTMMIRTRRPLRERMVLFWHDHFATSVSKVGGRNGQKYLYWQNLTERQFATGDFRALAKAMNRDPAMIWWLDNRLNVKGSPNENYARELFEIFMLGLEAFDDGVYTEPDVQQAARAFTGWSLRVNFDQTRGGNPNGPNTDPAMSIEIPPATPDDSRPAQRHDYGEKTVFGVTRNFNGDDIIDLALDKEPQRAYAARMLGRKLFEHFAYENPEPAVVEHLTAVMLRHNFNLKPFLRDLFLNVKEFYSEKAMHALIRNPNYYALSAVRLLQAEVSPELLLVGQGRQGSGIGNPTAMGMRLFDPPDVFGWPGAEEWATTSRLLGRAAYGNALATIRSATPGNRGIPIDQALQTGGLGSSSTAEQVADYFTSLLIQRPLANEVRQALVDYLKKNDAGVIGNFTLDAATIDKKVRGLIHLLLARPEAQNF